MNTKQWIILGTMVVAITAGSAWGKEVQVAAAYRAVQAASTSDELDLEEQTSEESNREKEGLVDKDQRGEALTMKDGACAPVFQNDQDPLLSLLGMESEELYDQLRDGASLAELASDRGADAQAVILLQTAQLTEQLEQRLVRGSITPAVYEAQLAELKDIVTASVYGRGIGEAV